MEIILNGSTYDVKEGSFITKEPLIEFPQHIRTTGQQERGGRSLMSSWWMENFENGYGCEKMDLASARQRTSIWDSTANTVIRGQVTNPAKRNETVIATYPPEEIFESRGSLYGIEWNGSIANITEFTGTTWAVATSHNVASQYKHSKVYMVGVEAKLLLSGHKPNYWSSAYERDAVTFNADIQFGKSVGLTTGDKVVHMPVNNNLAFVNNIDQLQILDRLIGAENIKVSEVPGAKNIIPFLGQDGYEGLFMFYPNKVTCFENFASDSNQVPYINLPGDSDENNAREVVVFNNNIIFPVGDALLAYAVNGEITDIGMDMFAGMPSDKQGKVVNLASSVRRLFAGVFDSGITKIFQFDGMGWSWVGQTPSMATIGSIFLSSFPDDESKLWHGGNAIATYSHFNYPFNNPLHKTGYTLEASSALTLPQYDGGIPNMEGVAFGFAIDGDFSSIKTLDAYYSLDGAVATTHIGQATESGLTHFNIGSGLGATHIRFQPKFVFNGTATETPVLRSAVLEYLKFPETREAFTFTLDLVKTAGGNLQDVKALVEGLIATRDTLSLVPFKYGTWATTYIKVMEMPGLEEIVSSIDSVYATTGLAALVSVRAVELGG